MSAKAETPQNQEFTRPHVLRSSTPSVETSLGTAFITLSFGDDGQPREVFINGCKAGSSMATISEATGRLISLLLRSPFTDPHRALFSVVDQLEAINIPGNTQVSPDSPSEDANWIDSIGSDPNTGQLKSFPHAVAAALKGSVERSSGLVLRSRSGEPSDKVDKTFEIGTPLGDAHGEIFLDEGGRLFEIFIDIGQSGSEADLVAKAISCLINLNLRATPVDRVHRTIGDIVHQLEGIGSLYGSSKVGSLPDGIARILSANFLSKPIEER